MSREMKDTGVIWCSEIPNEWKLNKVKNNFYLSKEKAATQNPIVLKLARSGVQVRDISTNEGQLAESYENYNPVQYGDLLLNPMDLYSGANCNMSEICGVISPAYANLRAKVDLNPKYYDYYFKLQYWTMAMFAHGKGVSFDNRWTINSEGINNYEIPVPLVEEQNKIVVKIENNMQKVTALISNQEQQIEKLKAYKQSLITEIVTKGLDKTVPMKDSGVEWIDKIPEGWSVLPVKSAFSFGKGLPITKADLTETGEKVISYGQIHAKYNSSTFVDEKMYRFVSSDYLNINSASLVQKNDFIFADTSEDIAGSGDFVFIDSNEVIFAGYHTVVLKCNRNTNNKFLAYLFMSDMWKRQIQCQVKGVKLFSISRSIISKTTMILPTEDEQLIISKFLDGKCDKINKLISIKQEKIEKLNDYKKSLIYEYVTGKKEVI